MCVHFLYALERVLDAVFFIRIHQFTSFYILFFVVLFFDFRTAVTCFQKGRLLLNSSIELFLCKDFLCFTRLNLFNFCLCSLTFYAINQTLLFVLITCINNNNNNNSNIIYVELIFYALVHNVFLIGYISLLSKSPFH